METRRIGGPAQAETRWAGLCHLSALLGYLLLPFWIPVGNIVGPAVIWLWKRQEMPFVDRQGKEALNFQITMTLAGFVALVLKLVLVGFVLFPLVFVADLVFLIIAAVRAGEGREYRYPFAIRFFK